jgi:hypothetical protein
MRWEEGAPFKNQKWREAATEGSRGERVLGRVGCSLSVGRDRYVRYNNGGKLNLVLGSWSWDLGDSEN